MEKPPEVQPFHLWNVFCYVLALKIFYGWKLPFGVIENPSHTVAQSLCCQKEAGVCRKFCRLPKNKTASGGATPGRARIFALAEIPPPGLQPWQSKWWQNKIIYQDCLTALADPTIDLPMPCHEQRTGAATEDRRSKCKPTVSICIVGLFHSM